MQPLPVHIAVLTIADDAATADHATARAISEKAIAAGHEIVDEELAKDSENAIRDQLVRWIAEENIDVIIVAAGVESEAASAALAPLVHQTLPGFTDLFRWLTFQEIGASAMLSAAEAAQCQSTFVFVLPAHEGAVRAAMDKLILPQLDVRTKPKNLVTQMPRLKDAAKKIVDTMKSQPVAAPTPVPSVVAAPAPVVTPAPVVAPAPVAAPAPEPVPNPPIVAAQPTEAVPTPIAAEKTAGGSGVAPKLPARTKTVTANTIARKLDDPPTKPIDIAKLEKQIALSTQYDAQTKQVQLQQHDAKTKVVDMSAHQAKTRVVDASRLPRVPPGADATAADDEEALTFRAPESTPRAKPPTGQIPSIAPKSAGTSPGTPAPTSRSATPSTPPARTTTPSTPPPIARTPTASTPPPSDRALTTPSFSTPIARTTPVAPYRAVSPPMTSRSTVATPPATPVVSRPPAATPPATPARAPAPASNATSVESVRHEVLTPETPVIALRKDVLSPETPVIALRQPRTRPPTAPPQPAATPPTAPPIVDSDEAETQAAAHRHEPAVEQAPARPTPPPNAAELWARSITPAAMPTVEEPEVPTLEPDPDDVEPAADDDKPSPISTLFSNQPARARTPTAPPAHLDTIARNIPPGTLPEGEFSYPSVKRSGAGIFLKLLVGAAVLAAGFFAFVKLYPTDEPPAQTAAVTPPPEPPALPPPVAVVEAPADAQQAAPAPDAAPAPAIEIEPPAPTKPAPAPATTPAPKPRTGSTKPAKPTTESPPATTETTPHEGTDTKPVPANPDCDEVSCVMTKYDRPCCERFKPSDGFTPRNVIPDELDRTMVKAGVETVKPRVVACGEKNGAKGTVRLAVSVTPEGAVKDVSVTESPDTALGECVAAAMRKARFGKSANGGEFNYPFVF